MSNIAIKGAETGTGVFTLESPATNTDRTLVLPDEAGTVLTSASSLPAANLTGNVAASQITTALNATGSAPIYAARAWVNFNGTGTVAIRAAGNVSSITDNGTGDYTLNFTTAMPDVNYISVFGSTIVNSGRGGAILSENQTNILKSTTQLRLLNMAFSSAASDATPSDNVVNNVTIHR